MSVVGGKEIVRVGGESGEVKAGQKGGEVGREEGKRGGVGRFVGSGRGERIHV